MKHALFYSWECLTLDVGNRDLDLVVRSEKHMKQILKFLIYSLRTMDGRRGTADKMLNLMNQQSFKEHRITHGLSILPKSVKQKIVEKNEHNLFRKVYMKYLILKVRAKISYMAFIKRMTIIELFATTILKCHQI